MKAEVRDQLTSVLLLLSAYSDAAGHILLAESVQKYTWMDKSRKDQDPCDWVLRLCGGLLLIISTTFQ